MILREVALTDHNFEQFNRDGFLIIPQLLNEQAVGAVANRLEPLFCGKFETGVFPDEWYWREGLSLPDVTRHMANAWKCDRTIARVVLSEEIGRLTATLAGWQGARLGQDTIWWKTPGSKEIALHQDSSYISFLDPPEMMTCWIALDETSSDAGTIEYARGSHRWFLQEEPGAFHAPAESYHTDMDRAAAHMGIAKPEIVRVEVSAGDCVIHHGKVWHGSGRNTRMDKIRRSVGVHTLRADTQFKPHGAGYIYGRYKRVGDISLDESFFPVLWTQDGYRSAFLDDYLVEK